MSRARDIADVIGVKLTSPIVQTDSIKDDSGTRELASDSGSAWSWGSGVPSKSIVQVRTYSTTSYLSGTIDGQSGALSASHGTLFHTINFTPEFSTSTILFQTSNISCAEDANVGDGFWALLTDDTTVFAKSTGTIEYVSWNNAYNATVISFNHAFSAWSGAKDLKLKFGVANPNDNANCHVNYPSEYGNTSIKQSTRVIGLSLTEIAV